MSSMIPYDRYQRALRAWPFDDLFEAPFQALAGTADGFKMDVEETGNGYVVTAELPGVARDQIDVELNEGRLSITVDKKDSDEQKAKNYLQRETGEYTCTRGVFLKDAATAAGEHVRDDAQVAADDVRSQAELSADQAKADPRNPL